MNLQIVDVRGLTKSSNTDVNMKDSIIKAISTKSVPFTDSRVVRKGGVPDTVMVRSLPTMILYDDKGLELFDKITYSEDYYLTNAEIEILKEYSTDMVRDYIQDGDVLIELGAGAMRKTKYILEAITESKKSVTYYAVDLANDSLRESLKPLADSYPAVKFVGLWGTYHDSLHWIQSNIPSSTRKRFLWLGSSIGNLSRQEAVDFFKMVKDTALNAGDLFWCGIDRRNSFETVSLAYNDRQGISRAFSLNGLTNINTIFKSNIFNVDDYEFVSIYNEIEGRHEAYFESKTDQTVTFTNEGKQIALKKGELISFEYSYKYSELEVADLLDKAQLSSLGKWSDTTNRYDFHIFYKPIFFFKKQLRNDLNHVPSLEEWESIWITTDFLTTKWIDSSRYQVQPIDLRRPYIFYLGHLPGFLDIQLAKLLILDYYSEIFERGIDPIMEDPTQIHPHSKAPDQWPNFEDIYAYRDVVRDRCRKVIKSSSISKPVARCLTMCYEHEAMHIETLLYMLMQENRNNYILRELPIPVLKAEPMVLAGASWIPMAGGVLEMGQDDYEVDDFDPSKASVRFGWDIEGPSHKVEVLPFEIQHRPVTCGEYFAFLMKVSFKDDLIPMSWTKAGSEWYVKSMYGPILMKYAVNWPVSTSLYHAKQYALHHGADIATEAQICFAQTTVKQMITDNHSFSSLIPKPVQANASCVTDLIGSGWELTKTPLAPFDGFVKSILYPGYSSDFFDDKHFVVLGGSWATAARIAERSTFRNCFD
ncbi:histidine-specific methyltransferase [Globomyces pollinis-pini]|nr:histidine-specific methyltransferase [Globomyces pollinis-pini]